ncbi:MAG TPA: alpha/beta hydrolase [Bryobacteraceae bacterium]|nr:alpha/beta hydrolase [Bryobacteraceae bacterium]
MTPLVLVPGLMCDRTVWEAQIRALSGIAECQVVDHGSLDSLPGMAEAVLRNAPPKFALAGHSMGGRVALEVVRRAPERVERLAILDTKYSVLPQGEAGDQEKAGRYALLAIARSKGVRTMAEKWVQGMVHPDRLGDSALIGDILDMFSRKTANTFAAQLHALIHRPDAGPVLTGIHCPALILCGKQDAWAPPQPHEEMARAIQCSTLVLVENAGHMVTMEQPEEVSRAMRSWLRRQMS